MHDVNVNGGGGGGGGEGGGVLRNIVEHNGPNCFVLDNAGLSCHAERVGNGVRQLGFHSTLEFFFDLQYVRYGDKTLSLVKNLVFTKLKEEAARRRRYMRPYFKPLAEWDGYNLKRKVNSKHHTAQYRCEVMNGPIETSHRPVAENTQPHARERARSTKHRQDSV